MKRIDSPGRSVRALEFGRGGDAMEYFFAGSLAVVIIGALGLTVYFTFFKSSAPAGANVAAMYKCTKCGAEFEVDDATRNRLQESANPRADCPKCGAAKSALPMVKCFACGKYYVRPSLLKRGAKDVCPYCGKDYYEALNEYVEKQAK